MQAESPGVQKVSKGAVFFFPLNMLAKQLIHLEEKETWAQLALFHFQFSMHNHNIKQQAVR